MIVVSLDRGTAHVEFATHCFKRLRAVLTKVRTHTRIPKNDGLRNNTLRSPRPARGDLELLRVVRDGLPRHVSNHRNVVKRPAFGHEQMPKDVGGGRIRQLLPTSVGFKLSSYERVVSEFNNGGRHTRTLRRKISFVKLFSLDTHQIFPTQLFTTPRQW